MANWYCEIEGLEEVMQKIQKLQDIDAQQVLQDIAKEGQAVVKSETAAAGFPESSKETGIYNPSKNHIDIGFSGNFDGYRALWFSHWGYRIHWTRGNRTYFNGKTYTLKIGCWDNIRSISIQQLAPVLKARMKRYIDSQIK